MSVQPQGEALRKAVQWISEQRKEDGTSDAATLAEKAAIRFDLSVEDSEFLLRFIKENP